MQEYSVNEVVTGAEIMVPGCNFKPLLSYFL